LLPGLTITDAGLPPTKQVFVKDSTGIVTDLTTGSLAMNNDVVELDSKILDGATDLSVAFWVKSTSTRPFQTIFDAGSSRIIREFTLLLNGTNRHNLWIIGAGVDVININAGVTLTDGNWHHLAVVRNATDNRWRFFVEGNLVRLETCIAQRLLKKNFPESCN